MPSSTDQVFDPNAQDIECHKKAFYDLPSIQLKLGITQVDVDKAWQQEHVADEPIYLCDAINKRFWISTYTS